MIRTELIVPDQKRYSQLSQEIKKNCKVLKVEYSKTFDNQQLQKKLNC